MKYPLLILIIILALIGGCKNGGIFSDKIDEGCIQYDIKYLEDEKENPLIALLPTTMSFKFKDENSMQRIEGWMGIFSMAGINNVKKGTYSALLKIMNEKYCYQTNNTKEPFGFDKMPGMKIELVEGTKQIAGLECKRASVTFQDTSYHGFDIYYTDKFSLKDPNCHNPFRQIPGIILEYQMAFQDIKMQLKATKIEEIELNDEEFDVPDGYKKVSREKIDEVIKSLM